MLFKQPMKKITPLLLVVLLSSCSMVPDYQVPVVETPAQWRVAEAHETIGLDDFWSRFGSNELIVFQSRAQAENLDLRAAMHRVTQSRARLDAASASLLPGVDVTGGFSGNFRKQGSAQAHYTPAARGGLGVGYELDLFGANRAQVAAAEAGAAASVFDRDTVALVIAADVGRRYAGVLGQRNRLAVARENRKTVAGTLTLLETRFKAGAASALEVEQQKTALASTDAGIAALERALDAELNALAVLLGMTPQQITVAADGLDNLSVPDVAPGQPSSLLARRPDIRRAEAALVAANADIGVARAAFFPSVNVGLAPSIAVSPLTSPAVSALELAASLSAPLFTGGRLTANVEQAEARRAELAESYRKAILIAFQETEDALSTVKSAEKREAAYRDAAQAATRAHALADTRFKAGAADYLTLLDAERSLLTARDNLAAAKLDRVLAAIDLYKAAGGGWKPEMFAQP